MNKNASRRQLLRFGVSLTAAAVIAPALAGCSWLPIGSASGAAACGAPESVSVPKGELRLEGDPWSGYITARDDGFKQVLKARGYVYSYHEELDQAKRACNMTTGQIDFMVTTLGQFLKHKPLGQVVGMIDESAGADALALDTVRYPYLKSTAQLGRLVREFKAKGKKPVLAYTGDSPSEELRDELTNTFDEFRLSDFDLLSVDQSSTAFDKLQKGEAQLAIIWEPDTTAAKLKGYTVALSSKDVPNRILDVIIASNRIIKNDPNAVQAFVTEWYRARQWNIAHPAEFEAAIAKDGSLSVDDAKSVLAGIHLFDGPETDRYLNVIKPPLDEKPVWEAVQAIAGIQALEDPSLKVSDDLWNGQFAARAVQEIK